MQWSSDDPNKQMAYLLILEWDITVIQLINIISHKVVCANASILYTRWISRRNPWWTTKWQIQPSWFYMRKTSSWAWLYEYPISMEWISHEVVKQKTTMWHKKYIHIHTIIVEKNHPEPCIFLIGFWSEIPWRVYNLNALHTWPAAIQPIFTQNH